MSVKHPPRKSHQSNNLDLLRLLFASLVLLSHAPELLDGNRGRELFSVLTNNAGSFGEFAVAGFFALSGFLIMTSWCRQPRLGIYFRNRVLRIYPAFVIAFCISVLLIGPLAANDVSAYFHQFTVSRYVFSMLTLREPWFAHSFPGIYDGAVNGAMWTISYEFTCYIAVALAGRLSGKHLNHVWFAATVLLLVAACFGPELKPLPQVNRFYVAPLVRMSAPFFVGGSLSLLGFRGFRSWPAITVAGLLFVATWFSIRFHDVGFAIFGTIFFISIGLARNKIAMTRDWPDISYGTYLYGWPIIELILWSQPQAGPWLVFAESLAASLICGYLSWTIVEAPFMRIKARSTRTSTAEGFTY